MIKLYDVVRIKDSGITGIVTNISSAKGRTVYTVENNKRGRTGIPGARNDDSDSFAVFDCMKGKLEKVSGGEEYFFPSIGGWVWRYECCGNTWETTDAFENKGYFCPTCGELVTNRTLVRKGNEIIVNYCPLYELLRVCKVLVKLYCFRFHNCLLKEFLKPN